MRGTAPPTPGSSPSSASPASRKPTAPPPPEGWRETTTTYPPELLSLMPLDRLCIERQPDGSKALRSWHSESRYNVIETSGQLVYTAYEESNPFSRSCLGKSHPWDIHLIDKNNRELLRFSRHFRCDSCCFPCCLQKVTVYANDEVLGSITQNWNAWRPSFTIRDSKRLPVLLVKGPFWWCCGGEVDFIIKSIDDRHRVGVISKKWTGFAREFFNLGNSFALGFPVDLDVKFKALLMGACFLIDFVYFEERSNYERLERKHSRSS